jgi:hypothetical protein
MSLDLSKKKIIGLDIPNVKGELNKGKRLEQILTDSRNLGNGAFEFESEQQKQPMKDYDLTTLTNNQKNTTYVFRGHFLWRTS